MKLYLVTFLLLVFAGSATAADRDYHSVLGVLPGADNDAIKTAYRKLSMKYHPDRHLGESAEELARNEAKFKEVKAAYEFLSDPSKYQASDDRSESHTPSPSESENYDFMRGHGEFPTYEVSGQMMRELMNMPYASIDTMVRAGVSILEQYLDLHGGLTLHEFNLRMNVMHDVFTRLAFNVDGRYDVMEALIVAAFTYLKKAWPIWPEAYDYYFKQGYEYLLTRYNFVLERPRPGDYDFLDHLYRALDFAHRTRVQPPRNPCTQILMATFTDASGRTHQVPIEINITFGF